MKRLLSALLLTILCLTLTSCSSKEPTNEERIKAYKKDDIVFELIEEDYIYITVEKGFYAPRLTCYISDDDSVDFIFYGHLKEDDPGVVYMNKNITSSSGLTIEQAAKKQYEFFLKEMGISEEELVELVEWYFEESY